MDFIRKFLDEEGYSPTYRDICKGMGFESTNAIAGHVKTLRKQGFLKASDRPRPRIALAQRSSDQQWREKAEPLLRHAAIIIIESAPHRYKELKGIRELIEDNTKMDGRQPSSND